MTDSRAAMRLEADRLSVMRGGRLIVAGASFSLASGESILLKGANGAGKTSILRVLAGLLPPASGEIRLNGAAAPPAALREAAIYAGHADGVKAAMTGAEHLRFWAALHGAGTAQKDAAVEALGLAAFVEQRAAALSAGQKRRLGLARLILSRKPLWLLDEPTASMDADSSARLIAAVLSHLREGGAALIATHDRIALPGARALIVEAAA